MSAPKAYVFRHFRENIVPSICVFLSRAARHPRKLNSTGDSQVTIPLAKRLFFQPFRSPIATLTFRA